MSQAFVSGPASGISERDPAQDDREKYDGLFVVQMMEQFCISIAEVTALISFVDIFGGVDGADVRPSLPDSAFFISEIAEERKK